MGQFNAFHKKIIRTGCEFADRLVFRNTKTRLNNIYDVATYSDKIDEEGITETFARLMRLEADNRVLHYRVCLYDEDIMRFIEGNSSIDMLTFIVYIMTHELLHIHRIERGEAEFNRFSQDEEVIVDNLARIFLAKYPVTGRQKVFKLLDNVAPPPLYNQRAIIDNGGIFDAYL